ncbi:MAG: squalene--hopene cyclase [Acidobacteria bacterium]|nr:MAG: squalene--hopene cyclase [Acidobacteriota bacterium]
MTREAGIELEPFKNGGADGTVVADLDLRVQQAIERAAEHLLSLQTPEGYWVGELQADSTLESDYVFFLHVVGQFDPERIAKLANYIRHRQLPDGGWNIYQGGPSELNATVKAYVALKLAGDSADDPHMAAARSKIHKLGGLEQTNSYTRFYLALGGAVKWKHVPAIPPELMLPPKWFFFNLYSLSSWTRAIVVPLTILYAKRPKWPVPAYARVDELFRDPSGHIPAFDWDRRVLTWRNLFLAIDRLFKLHESLPWKPLRKIALAQAQKWLLDHLERSEGLGAIYPAMVNSIFALLAMGYSADDPLTARELAHLRGFEVEKGDTISLQPCMSPVWDTAIAMYSLEEAGLHPDHPALVKAARWLLDRQIVGPGDWQVKNQDAAPGGWAFEFRNDFYPDVDDASFVMMALQRVAYPDKVRLEHALRRSFRWLVSMQNRDGGWGAFDRNNDCSVLTRVPFADHNAMIDPSTADVTARVLECIARLGWPASHPAVQSGLSYLRKEQTAEGAWYGRWGVNYVYGTSGVLRMLEAFGLGRIQEAQRGADWLCAVQNRDGGFGESCASYDDPSLKGRGASTPSQTAWGLIGLLATRNVDDPAVIRSVQYLLEEQTEEGFWKEDEFTGTGFPRVFYLCYTLYRDTFPLYALAHYQSLRSKRGQTESIRFSPAEFERHDGNGKKNGRN